MVIFELKADQLNADRLVCLCIIGVATYWDGIRARTKRTNNVTVLETDQSTFDY